MSEAEVASQFSVSRQPVRDAFFRLSELGFLLIRPQRATVVTKMSKIALEQAAFVRCALEKACLAEAMEKMTEDDLARLEDILSQQKRAVDAADQQTFHELDDAFHSCLCDIAGREHVWGLIKEHKSHVDRARFLSLPFSLEITFGEHMSVFEAIRDKDSGSAKTLMGLHLNRIVRILPHIQNQNGAFFEESE